MKNSDQILLECDNVSKQYGFFFALQNISFTVKENTILGILGANGAGKTTLIKILSDLSSPTSGTIVIKGRNYKTDAKSIKHIIGTITDKSFLYDELTIYENLKFYSKLYSIYNKNEFKEKIEHYTEKFDLSDWIFEPISNLSTGMKQKVEIIRILIHNPSLLLLDEPFSGLDFNTIKLLIEILTELREKKNLTIIIATHKIEVIQQISDTILILKRGKISKFAPKNELDKSTIETYF